MEKLSLESQLRAIDLAVGELKKWYAHEVNARHVKRDVADLHVDHVKAVRATLVWFKKNEDYVRVCVRRRAEILKLVEDEYAEGATGVDRDDGRSAAT